MMTKESNCNGCETCIGCGRGEYKTHVCDRCENNTKTLYSIDNREYCYECLEEYVLEEFKHDIFGEFLRIFPISSE